MIYLDVYIESTQVGKKVRLRPQAGPEGQPFQRCKTDKGIIFPVPFYWISGSKKIRNEYPVGTVFIADLQLICPERFGNYHKIRTGHHLSFPFSQDIIMSPSGQLKIF